MKLDCLLPEPLLQRLVLLVATPVVSPHANQQCIVETANRPQPMLVVGPGGHVMREEMRWVGATKAVEVNYI